MKKVLFVCLGNICRSPAAHATLQHKVDSAGLSNEYVIDSAGTAGYHIGELPDARMRQHGKKRGLQIDSRARQLQADDGVQFDWIFTMDDSNLSNAKRIIDKQYHHKIHPLLTYCEIKQPAEVPDPYYEEPEAFEFVLDLLDKCCVYLVSQHVKQTA